MENDAQRINLFERLKTQARFAPVPSTLFEDVANEAWLLAVDYAAKHNKTLESLSKTELRLRCFEASRKLLNHREISTDFSNEDTLTDSRSESSLVSADSIARLSPVAEANIPIDKAVLVLKKHPRLRLSPQESDLYYKLLQDGKGRWGAAYAKQYGISRQAVSNALTNLQRKVSLSFDLARCLDGDIEWFFEKYGKVWGEGPSPAIFFFLLPWRDTNRLLIFKNSDRIISALTKKAIEKMHHQTDPYSFIQAHYMLMAPAYMGSLAPTTLGLSVLKTADTSGAPPLLMNCISLRHLVLAEGSWDTSIEYIKRFIQNTSEEGRRFAGISASRTPNACRLDEAVQFLKSNGSFPFTHINYEPVMAEYFEYLKTVNPRVQDFYFAEFLLLNKYYPLEKQSPPTHTWNTIKILSQRAMHSENPFIAREAEQMLRKANAKLKTHAAAEV